MIKLNIQKFASGTIEFDPVKGDGSTILQGKVVWSSVAGSSIDNTHKVTTTLYARRTDKHTSTPTAGKGWSGKVIVGSNAEHKFSGFTTTKKIAADWVKFASYSDTVVGNDDGTCSVNIYGYVKGPNGTSLEGVTSGGSRVVTLDTIPRASDFTIQNTSGETITEAFVGQDIVFNIDAKSTDFHHQAVMLYGDYDTDGYFSEEVLIENIPKGTTTATFKLSDDIFLPLLPNKNGTFIMGIKTLNDNDEQIGLAPSITFKITVPDSYKPSISIGNFSDVSSVASINGEEFVKGKTILQVPITLTPHDTYGKITKYTATLNGETFTDDTLDAASTTTITLKNSQDVKTVGINTLTITVTDSRNNTQTDTKQFTVKDYFIPTISIANISRANDQGKADDDGTRLLYSFAADIKQIGNNKPYFKIEWRKNVAGEPWEIIYTNETDYGIDLKNVFYNTIEFSSDNEYYIRFTANDSYNTPMQLSYKMDTGFDIMNVNAEGTAVAFGKKSTAEGTEKKWECAMPAVFDKPLRAQTIQNMNNCASFGGTGNRWQRICTIKRAWHEQGSFVFLRIHISEGNNGNDNQNAYIDLTLQQGGTDKNDGRYGGNYILNALNTSFDLSTAKIKVKAINNLNYEVWLYNSNPYCRPCYSYDVDDGVTIEHDGQSFSTSEPTGTFCNVSGITAGNAGSGDIVIPDATDFNTKWENAELTADFKLYNDDSYCRYAKVGNLVNIQFVLSPASKDNVLNSYTETTAFVLPKEYRPSQNLNVLCQGTDTNVFCVGVNSSGNVNIYRYRNSASYSSTPPGTSTWLPCNITYMVDSGTLIAGGSGGVVEETDPTVPQFVKEITQEDIDRWNSGTGGGSSTGGSVILNKSIITISTNGTPTIANGDTLPLNKTVSVTGDKLIHDKENYQIVIGPGVTKVTLSYTVNGRSSSRQWYAIFRTRDGITDKIGMDTIGKSGADQYTTLCVTNKILDVLEGDRYCIKSYNTGSAVLNADIGSNGGTYMTMEVVEPGGSGEGGVSEETDPTVPDYVKQIKQEDIDRWNSGTGGDINLDDISSKMSKVLYDNPDGTSTTVQLTETYENFKYIEVFCNSSDNTYAYTRIENPVTGKRATVMGGWFGSAAYFKNCVLVLSGGDKINVTQGNNAQITGSKACTSASLADAMKVVKVVGYYDENVFIVGNNGTEIVNTNKPKNIITAYLSKATSMAMTAWEAKKVPLDAFIGNGDKLKLENGSIVVGEGVNQVRINASIRLAAEFAASYYCITIKVTKKDGTVLPVVAQYQQKHTVQVSNAIVISPYLENVSEGDIIDLLFTSSVTQTQSLVQNQITSLTVEAVEDGQIITVNNTIDGIPIGSEFEYDGEEVPDGYEEVPSIVDIVYPVGAIFMSTSPTDPQLLFEGTEWKQLKDKFLLAAGDTYEAGTSGGSDTHKHGLTSGWANINSSGKTIIYQYKTGTSWKANYQVVGSSGASSSTSYSDVTTLGGTTDNANNLPPYLTVYMWERIA